MDAQKFLAEFGHIVNAPGGVAKLRDLILGLAVQGRLVPQKQSEEPADRQLARIALAASRKTSIGRRKRDFLPTSLGKELSVLPEGWGRAHLRSLVRVLNGRAYSKQELLDNGTPVLRVGNLFTSNRWYYSNLELNSDKYCNKGDLLFAWSASFGPFIWEGSRVIFHYHIWKLDFYSYNDLNKRFIYIWLLQKTREIKASGHGISMAHMTKERFESLEVDLPPIEEQSRIVAKVDELMALCDKLEEQQQARRALQNVLRKSALQAVVSATSSQGLQDAWRRFEVNFGSLFQRPEDVQQLRDLTLDLAIRGLLVEQVETDEDVGAWLEKVSALKASLLKKKAIPKQTSMSDVAVDEYPFPLPKGWRFVRLGKITNKIGSGSTPRGGREVYVTEGVPFLRSQNVWNDGLRLEGVACITHDEHRRMGGTSVLGNDLLLNITGASLGRCSLVPSGFGDANVSQHVSIIRLTDPDVREYVHLCILSPYVQSLIWGRQVGMAREGLSKKVLEQFEIPFPPVEEQERIVARVEKLTRLFDLMEKHLDNARLLAERLAASVVTNFTGIEVDSKEEFMKAPQTELVSMLRRGVAPDVKAQAPLATILARHNGEMSAKDLWQRFGGEIDDFYAQLKTEVSRGWILEPEPAEVREKPAEAVSA